MSKRFTDYQDALEYAQNMANTLQLKVQIRRQKEFGKDGFNVALAAKFDELKAEIVTPERAGAGKGKSYANDPSAAVQSVAYGKKKTYADDLHAASRSVGDVTNVPVLKKKKIREGYMNNLLVRASEDFEDWLKDEGLDSPSKKDMKTFLEMSYPRLVSDADSVWDTYSEMNESWNEDKMKAVANKHEHIFIMSSKQEYWLDSIESGGVKCVNTDTKNPEWLKWSDIDSVENEDGEKLNEAYDVSKASADWSRGSKLHPKKTALKAGTRFRVTGKVKGTRLKPEVEYYIKDVISVYGVPAYAIEDPDGKQVATPNYWTIDDEIGKAVEVLSEAQLTEGKWGVRWFSKTPGGHDEELYAWFPNEKKRDEFVKTLPKKEGFKSIDILISPKGKSVNEDKERFVENVRYFGQNGRYYVFRGLITNEIYNLEVSVLPTNLKNNDLTNKVFKLYYVASPTRGFHMIKESISGKDFGVGFKDDIFNFFYKNTEPTDKDVDDFAASLGVTPEELKREIYKVFNDHMCFKNGNVQTQNAGFANPGASNSDPVTQNKQLNVANSPDLRTARVDLYAESQLNLGPFGYLTNKFVAKEHLDEGTGFSKSVDIDDFWVDVVQTAGIKESLWGTIVFGYGWLKVEGESGKKYKVEGRAYQKLADKYGGGEAFEPAPGTDGPLSGKVQFSKWTIEDLYFIE